MKETYDIHVSINKRALQTQLSLAFGLVLIYFFSNDKVMHAALLIAIVIDGISLLFTLFSKNTKEAQSVNSAEVTQSESESKVHKKPKPLEETNEKPKQSKDAKPLQELPQSDTDWAAFFDDM